MAVQFGHVGEFEEGREEWTQCAERLGHFLTANRITDGEKKRAVFLSVIGPKAYKLLGSLIAPAKPGEKTYEELLEVMTQHHNPPPSEVVQRYKFHTRQRQPGETIAKYVSELRSLAQTCRFGMTLETMIRDRLVCGVNNDHIQRRLLSETELDLKKALELALGMETAAKNVRELQGTRRAAEPQLQRDVCKVQREVMNNCYRCGKQNHKSAQCLFRTAKCHNCGKVDHIRKVCRQPKRPPTSQGRQVQSHPVRTVQEGVEGSDELPYVLHTLRAQTGQPLEVDLMLDGKPLCMEVDTGAAVSLVLENTYRSLFPERCLQLSKACLRTYSGESITVMGQTEVEVCYEEQRVKLPLLVVKGEDPSLFGRDWLTKIRLDWGAINTVKCRTLTSVLESYSSVFEPGLGTLQGYEAKIYVDPGDQPKYCRARSVPYAMRGKVEEELEHLVSEGIIEPVQFADWAAPIVPVVKSNGRSLRICGDFKLTVNQASKLDRYPILKVEDLFAKLAGGKAFTKLDMSQAYQQLLLDEESRKYAVINTHRGLFRYNRLPFGISSAPGIFQRVMESILSSIPGVVVYIDDVLVTGRSEQEHLSALEEVLRRIMESGLRLRKDKCVFLAPSVVYLGHQIDSEGLHPVVQKVKAVQEAPAPKNVSELKSYLGLLTYYSRFLPNLSSELAPLYKLLKHNEPWHWTSRQEKAFERSKELLLSSQLLVHFDPNLEIHLACDASSYGIGAVLSHKMLDGSEKPVGFVSRTLTDTEKKYSQIEKEGLACVCGVTRFHSYLFGHCFKLQTDHKPLLTLFNESKAVSPQASGRIQRWALTLASYEYTIVCRTTTQHANADAMSRLPLPDTPVQTPASGELVLMVERLEDGPISAAQIATWTRRDPLLSRTLRYIRKGWPDSADIELKPYWTRRLELTAHDGYVVWGGRVVVPPPGRESVLIELHGGHPGTSRMKSLARGLVWWPGMDQEIENMVKQCTDCQQSRPSPPTAPLHPWCWPTRPWTRLHVDFAGPMEGKMFLIVIDAHSKWIEVFPVATATVLTTIQRLRQLFAQFGIPESIVSDNGPQFAAAEFQEFCRLNGIRHIRVAPYQPSSNGLAERAVQVFKQGFRKSSMGTQSDRIARFLFQYRITPHTTTGLSPAEMLLGRNLRSRLDLLKPNLEQKVAEKQRRQQFDHDKHSRVRQFSDGEKVFVKNQSRGETWLPGHIIESSGPVSFKVQLQDGRMISRHQDRLRKRFTEGPERSDIPLGEDDMDIAIGASGLTTTTGAVPSEQDRTPVAQETLPTVEQDSETVTPLPESGMTRRYPSRVRKPPERY